MTNLADDDGDPIIQDDEDLEVLPDDDDDLFDDVTGLDEERPIDDTEFDLDGELPPDDL
ncbi:hypothetical protein ACLRGF_14965 [Mycetocola zhadangensis]|uniref:hypothetical protein n=1 Tax=Mycetocola zhadangensis TaxID=1164595 RepID=UPI003A4D3F0B